MEHTSVTQSQYISKVGNGLETDNCSYGNEEWQELEHFWGKEKNRLQDVDGRKNSVLSSSLEEHLLHDNFLEEPQNISEDSTHQILKGEDIKDIPTTYIASGFRPQELPAIGTYVNEDILPGFRYKVRKNLTDEYLFNGKAKFLESVGLGYGKRLTFEGDTLNENENFFWSDSSVHGYGFQLQTVFRGDVFFILDTKTEKEIGRVTVNNPCITEDTILNSTVGERGYVEKVVEVHFLCDVILNDSTNIFLEDIMVCGTAVIVRENTFAKAKISQITPSGFVIDSCLLFLSE